jgi:hypothetical protein
MEDSDRHAGCSPALTWTTDRGTLARVLAGLLDDGSGGIRPELRGLWLDLISMPQPGRGLTWLRNNPLAAGYLRGLARGHIPLTHAGLSQLESWRTAAHLRDLLTAAGALPAADRQVTAFERWSREQLTRCGQPHARVLRAFITWCLLPRLHRKAARGPLTAGSRNAAAASMTAARTFLAWLDEHGRRLDQASQADIDTWHASGTGPDRARAFLTWAMRTGRMPRLALPPLPSATRAPVSQHTRLTLLNRFLTDEQVPLRTRVAACLVLLYAQPVVRLIRLTITDIITSGTEMTIRLGDPPVPVPEPLAALITELAARPANMNTASNPACDWLFPGTRAGQPITPGALLHQLRAHAMPVTRTRTATFAQLVTQAPAPVIAQALGYHPGTATAHLAAAGGTWARYPSARTPR